MEGVQVCPRCEIVLEDAFAAELAQALGRSQEGDLAVELLMAAK